MYQQTLGSPGMVPAMPKCAGPIPSTSSSSSYDSWRNNMVDELKKRYENIAVSMVIAGGDVILHTTTNFDMHLICLMFDGYAGVGKAG